MRRRYERDGELSSVCLASPTGSGKTVMCAAAIEALFFGDDDLGLVPDENAVVLWLSDSPSLNEQTGVRFSNVSDKLADSVLDRRHLVTITNDFGAAHDILEPRHVYFLSKDLLSKNGLLTKGGEAIPGRMSGISLTAPSGIPSATSTCSSTRHTAAWAPMPRASAARRLSTQTSLMGLMVGPRCRRRRDFRHTAEVRGGPWTSAPIACVCQRSL